MAWWWCEGDGGGGSGGGVKGVEEIMSQGIKNCEPTTFRN